MTNICTLDQATKCAERLKTLCSGAETYIFGKITLHGYGDELGFVVEVAPSQYERFRQACIAYNNQFDEEEQTKKKIHWFARKTDEADSFYDPVPPKVIRTKKALSVFELMERHLSEIAKAGNTDAQLINVICLPEGWKSDSDLQSRLQEEISTDEGFYPDSLVELIKSAKKFSIDEKGIISWI